MIEAGESEQIYGATEIGFFGMLALQLRGKARVFLSVTKSQNV
jgi:hypothetical protein